MGICKSTATVGSVPVGVCMSRVERSELGRGRTFAFALVPWQRCAAWQLDCWVCGAVPCRGGVEGDVRTVATGGGHACGKLDQMTIQTECAIGKPFWCRGAGVQGHLGVGHELDDEQHGLTVVCLRALLKVWMVEWSCLSASTRVNPSSSGRSVVEETSSRASDVEQLTMSKARLCSVVKQCRLILIVSELYTGPDAPSVTRRPTEPTCFSTNPRGTGQ